MSKNILVTGAGGGSGLATIRILKESGYNVIATDASENASGLYLGSQYEVVPMASDDNFVSSIHKIIDEYNVDVIFPNVDEELRIFSDKKIFPQAIISPTETIDICSDKLKTLEILNGVIDLPKVFNYNDVTEFPLLVKPRVSRGSKNIYKVNTKKELGLLLSFLESNQNISKEMVLIQEYLPGDEYTIDSLFDLDGNFVLCVPRKRSYTYGGISAIGETIHDNRFEKIVKKIGEVIKFNGPVNIQVKEDVNGVLKLMEINPRLSGGLPITYKSGINLPDLSYKLFSGINFDKQDYKNVKVFRYLNEV